MLCILQQRDMRPRGALANTQSPRLPLNSFIAFSFIKASRALDTHLTLT
jgi:hypothetical protein